MNTPICDFVKKYSEEKASRLHMPGHKGKSILGFEELDITEIDGADSLYEASGIIRESERNASSIFGAETFYSAEGSSQCIKAMLSLICQHTKDKPLIWAGRNAHKSFLSAAVLLDFDTEWLYPQENTSYLSCKIDPEYLDKELKNSRRKPDAVYITSPDYLGNTNDIKALAEVCHKNNVLLIVDNAHGAYLKFLETSLHPIDLGADMCCDSAHKTLPVITGGAYLHLSEKCADIYRNDVKTALSLFGSTSPSYLILQSLDMANKYLADGYKAKLKFFAEKIWIFKKEIKALGYTLIEDEILKITIDAKKYGYTGYEIAERLKEKNIYCEFADPDFAVIMVTPYTSDYELGELGKALEKIERKPEITLPSPQISKPLKAFSPRKAAFAERETIPVCQSLGRILAVSSVGCPPAVPIIAGGEIIDENVISCFRYYNIEKCTVIKQKAE